MLTIVMGGTTTPFTLGDYDSRVPADWNATITQPMALTSITVDGNLLENVFVGTIEMSGGTPVQVGDPFEFGYSVTFSGGTLFSFTQQMEPTPEPATLGLLVCGALGIALRRRSFRRV